MEPPVSEPSEKSHKFAETAAAEPEEVPPGINSGFFGFFQLHFHLNVKRCLSLLLPLLQFSLRSTVNYQCMTVFPP